MLKHIDIEFISYIIFNVAVSFAAGYAIGHTKGGLDSYHGIMTHEIGHCLKGSIHTDDYGEVSCKQLLTQ